MPALILALEWVNQYILSVSAALLLLGAGLYFTLRFRAFYVRHPLRTLRAMPLESGAGQMLLSLGGTVGVGNISGVALGILYGGAGAVFWMWVGALLSMALKYAEIILAMATRKSGKKGFFGGAPYYIKEAFGKAAAALFAALLIFDSAAMGGVIQSSAISEAAQSSFFIPPVAVGIVVSLLAAAVFFFRVNVFSLSAYIVPVMSVGYCLAALLILSANVASIPSVFSQIVRDAFRPAAGAFGLLGFLLSPALRQGIVKGLFSNEAGCGTATMSHVSSKETVPARQGLFGIFEVFCDTILMCTLTAFVILLTLGSDLSKIGGGGVLICALAFGRFFGAAAGGILSVFVFLFAFATIVSFGYYGVQSLAYFTDSAAAKKVYLIFYCLSLFIGAVAAPAAVWTVSDFLLCVMMLLNTAAVLICSKKVIAEHKRFYAHIGKYSQRASKMRTRSASGTKKEIPMSEKAVRNGLTE